MTAAWISSLFLVLVLVYWFSVGKEQYSSTCFSNGQAAMMVGIYPEANRYFNQSIRYSNAPKTLGNQIKNIYFDHLHHFEEEKQFPQVERVMGFILELFPEDPQCRRYAAEMRLLFTPANQLAVGQSQLFPGVNGCFLKDSTLLLEDPQGQRWRLDPAKMTEKKVFPVGSSVFLASSPSGGIAAVIESPQAASSGNLVFLNSGGKVLTRTNLLVNPDSRCSWSPDEGKVAIDALLPTGAPFIALVDVASGEIRQFEGKGSKPEWSPLGEAIAFLDASASLSLCSSLEGKKMATIPLEASEKKEKFTWSPKGDALLVEGETSAIYDERGKKLLSFEAGKYQGFCWAPSGNKLAAAQSEEKINEITVFDLNGGTAKIPLSYPVSACAWSYDGTRLALNYREGKKMFLNLISLERKKTQRSAKPRIPS